MVPVTACYVFCCFLPEYQGIWPSSLSFAPLSWETLLSLEKECSKWVTFVFGSRALLTSGAAALFAGGVVSSAFGVAGDPRKAGEWSSIWVGWGGGMHGNTAHFFKLEFAVDHWPAFSFFGLKSLPLKSDVYSWYSQLCAVEVGHVVCYGCSFKTTVGGQHFLEKPVRWTLYLTWQCVILH